MMAKIMLERFSHTEVYIMGNKLIVAPNALPRSYYFNKTNGVQQMEKLHPTGGRIKSTKYHFLENVKAFSPNMVPTKDKGSL